MRRFDLLIFDWDGTLADSAALIVAGMQEAIVRLRLPARTDLQIRELIGLGFHDAMSRLYPEFAPEDIVKALEEYRRLLLRVGHAEHGPAEAPLFEGALATLRALRAAGYRIAVATGKSRASLERSLKRHPEVRELGLKRTFLHALSLRLPAEGPFPALAIESPLPAELEDFLKKLK